MGLILNGSTQYGHLPNESIFNRDVVYSYAVAFKVNLAATATQFVFGGFNSGGLTRYSGTVYRAAASPKYIAKVKSSSEFNYPSTTLPAFEPTAGWNIHIFERTATGSGSQASNNSLNSGAVDTAATEENTSSDINKFGVGARRNSAGTYIDFLDGAVAYVAVWNRALTVGEKSGLNSGGNPADITSGLVEFFNFSTAGSPSTVTGTNGRVMTLVGSPSIDTATPIVAPAYSIDSTNSGADDLNAGAVNTASVTGYVVGVNPVVSGTVGSLALTSVSQSGGVVSATIPAPVNNSYWPEPDASHLLTFTDGSNPATFNAVMNSLDGYTSIVAVSPDLADPHKIPYWLTSTAEDGDRIMYKTADMTVAADWGISGATLGATTIYYHWRVADSKIYAYEALLSEDGIATSTGLTVRGLSVSGLGVRGLTVRGIGGVAACIMINEFTQLTELTKMSQFC